MTIDEIYSKVKACKAAFYKQETETFNKLSAELRSLHYSFIDFELSKLKGMEKL